MTSDPIDLPPNVVALREMVRDCTLCPRQCRVDRTAGKVGACRIGGEAVVASFGPHFGEEPVLVGRGGSGTIFFAGCNLDCVFCQNADISHSDRGQRVSPEMLARIMLSLQVDGCENVNVVSPTHVSHAVAEAIVIARAGGLARPIVYNCGGYESVDTLKLLDGLVEIYMPDFKYADADAAKAYSGVADYPQVATAALAEMHRQVGPLQTDSCGVAIRGVLVRHLVLPGDLADSRAVIDIVAETAPGCAINVMAQYRPCYRADEFDELLAYPSRDEIAVLRKRAGDSGLAPVD
ncbi:MAG: radical SAM protein [Planctomycetota bacterium]|jgi:putative pyruvate formate lyase activating enzyme